MEGRVPVSHHCLGAWRGKWEARTESSPGRTSQLLFSGRLTAYARCCVVVLLLTRVDSEAYRETSQQPATVTQLEEQHGHRNHPWGWWHHSLLSADVPHGKCADSKQVPYLNIGLLQTEEAGTPMRLAVPQALPDHPPKTGSHQSCNSCRTQGNFSTRCPRVHPPTHKKSMSMYHPLCYLAVTWLRDAKLRLLWQVALAPLQW